jgi:hypothetical protein
MYAGVPWSPRPALTTAVTIAPLCVSREPPRHDFPLLCLPSLSDAPSRTRPSGTEVASRLRPPTGHRATMPSRATLAASRTTRCDAMCAGVPWSPRPRPDHRPCPVVPLSMFHVKHSGTYFRALASPPYPTLSPRRAVPQANSGLAAAPTPKRHRATMPSRASLDAARRRGAITPGPRQGQMWPTPVPVAGFSMLHVKHPCGHLHTSRPSSPSDALAPPRCPSGK